MEWLNISLSILAIAVAIFAIIQTGLIANKSNNIALLSQRIEFYNKITNIIEIYSMPSTFKDMLNAKDSKSFFSQITNSPNPITIMTLNYLASQEKDNNIIVGFQRLIKDTNYLEINKYLFDDEIIINSISSIENKLTSLNNKLADCLAKQQDDNIDNILTDLANTLKTFKDDNKNIILKTIASK